MTNLEIVPVVYMEGEPGEHYQVHIVGSQDGAIAWFKDEADAKHYVEWKQRALEPTAKRCCCGTHEWEPDAVQIEDSRGVLHYADRPCHHK